MRDGGELIAIVSWISPKRLMLFSIHSFFPSSGPIAWMMLVALFLETLSLVDLRELRSVTIPPGIASHVGCHRGVC